MMNPKNIPDKCLKCHKNKDNRCYTLRLPDTIICKNCGLCDSCLGRNYPAIIYSVKELVK